MFIRRAERANDPWSGHIALPGGRREARDADLLATAVRETREEVGVRLPARALLGALADLSPRATGLPPLSIRPFVFGLPARPPARVSDEVAAVIWLPLAGLRERAATAVVTVGKSELRVPCFKAGGIVIWGLTYRILTGVLPLVLQG